MSQGRTEERLQTRYLDWCSAQIVRQVAMLSPSEIWERVQLESERETSLEELGYRVLVQRLTRIMARDLDLPPFADWLDRYRRDPEAVERELLGFEPGLSDALPFWQTASPTDSGPRPDDLPAAIQAPWEVFFDAVSAVRGTAEPGESAALARERLASSALQARQRTWHLLSRILHWPAETSLALLNALTLESALWVRTEPGELDRLSSRLQLVEERFRSHLLQREPRIVPVKLASAMYLSTPQEEHSEVVPYPGADTYVTDGVRYGVRFSGGETRWFPYPFYGLGGVDEQTDRAVTAAAEEYLELHPLLRVPHTEGPRPLSELEESEPNAAA